MADIILKINAASPLEEMAIRNALQTIATNFSKNNLQYIAELSNKPNVNEKFEKLKTSALVKTLL